ncbi:MAG: sigma-70 family RNA polymerase sigma factor [Hymenobacteraceae bacterium]|nr:sigma-70 family RNA polymerase sigma factor [Hymenobacteraceae bacterium]MDX5394562.1 sigma-70 family RNA polymerase sigma factor [Hymenobacteraceae bacterium]MDX5443317.1 sigma-70 family RNA polymerase sigma factor [Hymenobacteraceae bacterium]MDX5510583.1 sigma-70 family RNA polymerase sigma factor [Hymenobacteraceae bacterium]
MLTEKEIIEGCKKGKAACQEELYRRYSARMMSLCLRYAKTNFEAEDVFQEAFVNVFNNIDAYGAGSFVGWMRRIFVNTAINNYRKNKIHYGHLDSQELEVEDNGQIDILQDLTALELMEHVNVLPDGYRLVFNLYVVEGYTHKEIAETLGIAEGTSKSQLAKAKSMLKKNLEKVSNAYYAYR